MFIIRPIREDDLDRLVELAASIEGGGMTTLPADRDVLAEKIRLSTENFAKEITQPGPETYLLVLEDTETGRVGGTAAIFARIGIDKAFYTYSLTKTTHVSVELGHHNTHDVLHLVNDYIGFAEVGSLYLAPDFRQPGNGRLLARARYLLMGQHPERFPDEVVAEMRGWQDKNGISPFWEALGRRFFNMTFQEADHFSAVSNNQFIADLMPKFPVYVDLLPEEARKVIGVTHKDTVPALKLLEWEGFHYRRHVDIFDAGPCLQAQLKNIRAIKDAKVSRVAGIVKAGSAEADETFSLDIISTGQAAAFRATTGFTRLNDSGEIIITDSVAKALEVGEGDRLRHVAFKEAK